MYSGAIVNMVIDRRCRKDRTRRESRCSSEISDSRDYIHARDTTIFTSNAEGLLRPFSGEYGVVVRKTRKTLGPEVKRYDLVKFD